MLLKFILELEFRNFFSLFLFVVFRECMDDLVSYYFWYLIFYGRSILIFENIWDNYNIDKIWVYMWALNF